MTKKDIIYIVIIGVILVVFSSLLYNKNSDIDTYKNNIKSLTSELDSTKLKNGFMMYTMQSLILEKDELEKYLDVSKKEVKELERKLDSKVKYIASIEGKVTIDTLVLRDSVYIDPNGNMSLYFEYSDKWITLGGHSTPTTFDDYYTILDTLSMNVPLQVRLTDGRKIFVKTKNPYMNITDIQGSYIEESELRRFVKRFGICFYMEWGVQYGVIHQTFDTGPQIGLGVYYRLY
jgi:hypothetical protein